MPESLLRLRGLSKVYNVQVLFDLDLDLFRGEVHALVGANGAGKSTLARIVSGLTQPSGGAMTLAGEPYAPASKSDAEAAGVQMVMQELNLIPTLSIAENLFLNRLPRRRGLIRFERLHKDARAALAAVGLESTDPSLAVSHLGIGTRQLVEIAGALARPCRLLILDEPTAALTGPEIDLLFRHVRRLKQDGVSIIYISHRMEEIERIADRVTILRDGCVVDTSTTSSLSMERVVQLMAGRSPATANEEQPDRAPAAVALRVEELSRGPLVREVTFEVRHGEILGFAGLVGSGRTETMRALFGADRPDSGRVLVSGSNRPDSGRGLVSGSDRPDSGRGLVSGSDRPDSRRVLASGSARELRAVRIRHPRDAVRAGIGMIPEDRKQQGLLLPQAIRANFSLAAMDAVARARHWVDASRERRTADELSDRLDVRRESVEQPVAELSGGNQQKILIGRWLLRDCDVLLFDEPTRGIDVGAKESIYHLLRELAARGKAIVVVSSELRELMALCDRIAVMSAGRLAAIFDRSEWNEEKIMAAALSGYAEPSRTKPVDRRKPPSL